MENGDREENPLYLECQELVCNKNIKRFIIREGDRIEGPAGIRMRVLNPPDKKFPGLNDDSLVIKLEYKNFSALFCADILEDAARRLVLNYDEGLNAKILKIPHHGGNLGEITGGFIGKVRPEKSVISARGRKINGGILVMNKKAGTDIYRTDIDGAITVITDGKTYKIWRMKNN